MTHNESRAVAIVGVGAILPDAPNAPAFWQNICNKRYSIIDVPPERWGIADYYDPDPNAPDKSYSKIGAWVRGFEFDWKRFRIPPKVAAAMDESQQWAVTIAAEALADYGYPERPLDTERTGIILGTAMGGEQHYITYLRIAYPEYANVLKSVGGFRQLPAKVREDILAEWHERLGERLPPITEDTMPGELANIVSGRVANVLNLRGPNFITDAACASSFAAINSAVEILVEHHADAIIAGGVDRNMGASTFIKFCKIGALSASGSRPFGEGADGFVMGEGSASFLLKRLDDAERAGDRIYAVIRGVGASSDGKGKGITAPNPVGQVLAVRRAWENAGLDPTMATLVEAHGTSTRVGDVAEVESLNAVFGDGKRNSIALGSAKSNIGHLKAGAGAAGLLKTALAIYHKKLPPTLNAQRPNPNINFTQTPFFLNHDLQEWPKPNGIPRRAGVSTYGFGGTNFHLVLEEHIPGMLTDDKHIYSGVSVSENAGARNRPESLTNPPIILSSAAPLAKLPVRGILAIGAQTPIELKDKLDDLLRRVENGWAPPRQAPDAADLIAPERLALDFGNHDELLDRVTKARKAQGFDNRQAWKALQAQGIFRGSGPKPGKIAYLFPGQGSQYLNMGRELVAIEPVVAQVFAEADRVMTPILGKPLTDFIFVDSQDPIAMQQAELGLMQTEITQPAMLAMDTAIYQLLSEYGFGPDMAMGHSLGEYGALIAAGIMPFADALEASAARGAEMTKVSMGDNGWMAAVFAPYEVVEQTLAGIDGYVVAANINSYAQCVIGGASKAVEHAIQVFTQKGFRAQRIPVSQAFHTQIVAPASAPLRKVLDRLHIYPPKLPLVANVTGELYPTTVEAIKDILELQIASPVQWVKGMETMYAAGVRTFVEVGPKKALKGFVDDVLGNKEDVWSLFTNHPKMGELPTFNQALCGLYAAGYGMQSRHEYTASYAVREAAPIPANGAAPAQPVAPAPAAQLREEQPMPSSANAAPAADALGQALMQVLQRFNQAAGPTAVSASQPAPYDRNAIPLGSVIISGTGLGLPGPGKAVMDPDNALRILHGEQFVDLIPERFRRAIVDKRITRLIKEEDGSGHFETISDVDDVIKLAGRGGAFDLATEYGVPEKLISALDITTQLAIAAGLDALREAGIPLVQTYRYTSKGTYLPDKWLLPEAMRDDTGVIFASAFPGGDRFADEFTRYFTWENRRQQIEMLEDLRNYTRDEETLREISRRLAELREASEAEPYQFDRRFVFRILAMGHSQFAEYIGARGPNTHVNAACAATAQGVALAEDRIRSGRCRRVIVIGADDVTSDHLMEWIGAGFLAVGAVATDDRVNEAALPFDRRRHGTILGMGACGLIVESEDSVRERGMRGIVELLSSETANSAYHGTRLDVNHISEIMNRLVTAAERRFGLNRYSMAAQTVFMSHETFTPARGGSAAAEVVALRDTFSDAANDIIVANTKGFTGHPMGVGIEDVIAVKILEYGIVPPVPNYKEVDPELGTLNLSRGGRYPVQFALHLAAGFGSQIAMTLLRRIPGALDRVDNQGLYLHWLADVSGYDRAETEIVKRVLRVRSHGAPARQLVANTWQYGTGPTVRAAAPGQGVATEYRPLPMSQIAAPRSAPARPAPTKVRPAPEPVTVRPPQQPATNGEQNGTHGTPAPAQQRAPVEEPQRKPAPLEAQVPEQPNMPASAPQPTAAPIPVSSTDNVVHRVLALVAEKTGYPQDMLDLDLDLEADLGIDTVKQAETFAAIREAFEIPFQEGLNLRAYPTLASVISFVHTMRPDLAPLAPAAQPVALAQSMPAPLSEPAIPAPAMDNVANKVLTIVAEKTGYPQDMLDLDLDLEADLGIDTVKQAETFAAIREAFEIPFQEGLNLHAYPTLASVISFVHTMRPDLAPVTQAPQPVAAVQSAPASTVAAEDIVADIDEVTGKVLAIVAEKTGYPQDMLDLDLDLEADLGVDTVKQAETFAAIREAFEIPFQEGLNLREYPTLASVISFVHTMRPDLAPVVQAPQPVAAAVQPASAPTAPSTGAVVDTEIDKVVADRVLAIVAEKTGYPQEMLELDLDLEADLGIDTVKQAETFAAVRETFQIPFQEGLNLRDYPTLAGVIEFVHTMRADLVPEPVGAGQSTSAKAEADKPVSNPAATPVPIGTLADADKMPRRVPAPALRPSLDLCKLTGVTLNEQSRVVIMLDRGGVGKALVSRLQKLGVTTLTIEGAPVTTDLEDRLKRWLADGAIQGIYWLPALDVEPNIEDMELAEWRELNRVRTKNLYIAMRTLYDSVCGPGAFLISATRLGGLHGYGSEGASAPLGGAVVGFTKAYHIEQGMRETGPLLVKAVDFEPSRKTAEPADQLIAETLTDPGVVEISYHNGLRYAVTLVEKPAADGQPGMVLDQDTVFVVTGAAGGITSAIVTDLAVASHGVFYLLDLVQAPPRDDPHVRLYRQDQEALKQRLIEEARAAGERPTPVSINKRIMDIERQAAALRAIEVVEAAGGAAYYRNVNLMDGDALAAIVDEVRTRHGRIDVLLHAGGLLIDRILSDKTPEQFDLVFDVKADGFFSLIKAAKGMPIGATVVFSSVAGRFGNNGQSDYSAANDLLCKVSSSMRSWRPDTRALAVDWTAWGNIGMASRGSVPQIMEALGIDMLQPEAGVPTIRRELTYGGARGEVLVAGRLGAWVEEKDPTGGLDLDKVQKMLASYTNPLLMVGEVKSAALYGGLEVQTTLDPKVQPFLADHAPDEGAPWLPGVMATEALAEVAALLAPGYTVTAMENVQMLSAFKFFRMEPRTLCLSAQITPTANGELVARAVLRSVTKPAKEGLPSRATEHFVADVRLSAIPPEKPVIDFAPPDPNTLPISADEIYKVFFHGPAYQVIDRGSVAGARPAGTALVRMSHHLPPNTVPKEAASLMAPRLMELCFQAAALWSVKMKGAMAFPAGIGIVTAYRQPDEAAGRRLFGEARTANDGASFDCRVIDEAGNVYVTMQGFRTVARPTVSK